MPFVGTILLLAAATSAILIPIFVGHGLAVHDNRSMLVALGAGAVSAVLVYAFSKVMGRRDSEEHGGH